MIFGYSFVFFLSLPTLVVFGDKIKSIDVSCGEVINITPKCNSVMCDPSKDITFVELKYNNTSLLKMENQHQKCVEDRRFCFRVEKDRKQMNLTMRGVTYADKGRYDLEVQRENGNFDRKIIHVKVHGICEPIVTQNNDELTCEVSAEDTLDLEFDWMSKERKIYPSRTNVNKMTGYVTLKKILNLTDETKNEQMCCTVSYKGKQGEEKQNCPPFNDPLVNPENQPRAHLIAVILIICIALSVAIIILYLKHHKLRSKWQRRQRTYSEQGLMNGNPAEENMDETQLEENILQRLFHYFGHLVNSPDPVLGTV